MKSMLKVILASMIQKKGRSIMMIVSIMFSVGLIYSVLSLSSLSDEIMQSQYKKEYGNTNVIVHKDDGTFIETDLVINESEYEYLIAGYNLYGYTYLEEDLTVNMYAYNNDEVALVYDIRYLDKLEGVQNDNQILIGESNSVKYGLSPGDTVIVSIFGESLELVVYGIVEEGLSFLDINPNTLDIIINKDFVKEHFSLINPNIYLMDLKDINKLNLIALDNPELNVLSILDQEELITDLKQVTVPIAIMASSIVLISSYIIMSTFKTIVIDRMSLIGTLRSLGATKKVSKRVLILESASYGFIGSIFGLFAGIGILYMILNMFFGSGFTDGIEVNYLNVSYALITILSGIAISVFSAYLPISKSVKYSIKDIIFGKIKSIKKFSTTKSIIGVILFIAAYIVLKNVGTNDYMLFSLISISLATAGVVLMIPLLLKIISPVINSLLYPFFKNNSQIAAKNIKQDQTLINNIVLLTIGLGVIFMINSFSSDVGEAVVGVYGNANYDIIIYNDTLSDEFITEIKEIDNVEYVYSNQVVYDIQTNNGFDLLMLEGVDPLLYDQYGWGIFKDYLDEDTLETFHTTDSIIVSAFTAKKHQLVLGDTIEIIHNNQVYGVEVVAIVPTIIQNGTVNYINPELFENIYSNETQEMTFIKVNGNPDIVKKEIKELYSYGVLAITTLDEMEAINQANNDMLFVLMKAISALAMLIGAVGIINNFIVSFISRRKLIASLRSLGLSQKGTIKLFMIESLLIGLLGSILGVLFGIVLYFYMGFVVEGMNISSEVMSYSLNQMAFVFISGLLLSILTSILPAINMSRRNIVSEIKYE